MDNLVKKSERGPTKNNYFLFLPSNFYKFLLPPPLPLYNVDLGNADCRETVRDPPNNIELGGGGGENMVVRLFTCQNAWKGTFLNRLSTIVSANFFPFPSELKKFELPGTVDRHTGRCSLSYAYVNVSVLFSRDVTSQK